jgi:signal transduction histidine kinase
MMSARDGIDKTDSWLLNLPPTSKQRWAALITAAALLMAFGVLAPFAAAPLPQIDSFIPSMAATISVTDFITSVLLFAHFSIYPSRALLALASGYLFVALNVIANALTYPGAFSPTGLFGASLGTSGWLYCFWHTGFAAALLSYSWLRGEKQAKLTQRASARFSVGWAVVIVFSLACGITWVAIEGESFLPRLFVDRTHIAPAARYLLIFMLFFGSITLATLWARRRSVLDQWLIVVALSLIAEMAFTLIGGGRFSLGAYANRVFSLVTATILLVALLAETTKLYGRLARSNAMLVREQNNRLMTLEALASSISHEVRQPLTAIVGGGGALLRYVGGEPPKLDKARSAAEGIIAAGHRASQILDDIRNLFGTAERPQSPIDMNDLAVKALHALDSELKSHKVTTRIQLASQLPPIMGYGGQLQEVLVNLIQNAIDAMASCDDGRRILQVRTEHNGDAISVDIVDTGPGIDPKKSDNIFDAFFTTKPNGMGLGLAICRMIVERHEGRLVVSSANPHGAVFRIMLPQMKSAALHRHHASLR